MPTPGVCNVYLIIASNAGCRRREWTAKETWLGQVWNPTPHWDQILWQRHSSPLPCGHFSFNCFVT